MTVYWCLLPGSRLESSAQNWTGLRRLRDWTRTYCIEVIAPAAKKNAVLGTPSFRPKVKYLSFIEASGIFVFFLLRQWRRFMDEFWSSDDFWMVMLKVSASIPGRASIGSLLYVFWWRNRDRLCIRMVLLASGNRSSYRCMLALTSASSMSQMVSMSRDTLDSARQLRRL